jgi:hypothetical protein
MFDKYKSFIIGDGSEGQFRSFPEAQKIAFVALIVISQISVDFFFVLFRVSRWRGPVGVRTLSCFHLKLLRE